MVLLQASGIILLADFFSGVLHWAEDTFGDENTPLVGKSVIAPNELHHHKPMAFLEKSWFESADILLAIGILVLAGAAVFGALSWQLILFVALGVNANQIHKWAHYRRGDVPTVIKWLQKARLIQTRDHHLYHHRQQKNTHYCVMTNFLNPVLDKIKFWRGLEYCLVPIFGAPRRQDLIDKGLANPKQK